MTVLSLLITTAPLAASKGRLAYRRRLLRRRSFKGSEGVKRGLKDKKSWWRVSPSCFGGGLCGGDRARR